MSLCSTVLGFLAAICIHISVRCRVHRNSMSYGETLIKLTLSSLKPTEIPNLFTSKGVIFFYLGGVLFLISLGGG